MNMDNQIDQQNQKTSISNCFFWLLGGALCCTSIAMMAINALNGTSTEGFSIGRILTGIVGISMLYRAIKGFQEIRADNPMPTSMVWFIWIIIALPTALSLWGILVAIFNISEYWTSLLNVIPFIIGVMAIAHVYENKTDAFYLIKAVLIIQAIGVLSLLLNAIDSPTLLNKVLFVFKFLLVAIGFQYLYFSKDIKAALPVETRTKSKLGKWLFIICIVIYAVFIALGLIGIFME